MELDKAFFTSYVKAQIIAVYQWLAELNCIPEIIVSTQAPGVQIPSHLKAANVVTLNISMSAAAQLYFGEQEITFSARFGSRPHAVVIPYTAILGITGREIKDRFMHVTGVIEHVDKLTESTPSQQSPEITTLAKSPVVADTTEAMPEKEASTVVSIFKNKK